MSTSGQITLSHQPGVCYTGLGGLTSLHRHVTLACRVELHERDNLHLLMPFIDVIDSPVTDS